jgi:hypothetical protein
LRIIIPKRETKKSVTEKNIAEHNPVKTKNKNMTFNPKSETLHRTYNVQQSRMKNPKIRSILNKSKPYKSRVTNTINKWPLKLFNKIKLPRKDLLIKV